MVARTGVLRALDAVSEDDEPLDEEDLQAIRAGREDAGAGRVLSTQVKKALETGPRDGRSSGATLDRRTRDRIRRARLRLSREVFDVTRATGPAPPTPPRPGHGGIL